MARKETPAHTAPRGSLTTWHPFDSFQQEMERWFDRALPERFSTPFYRIAAENGDNGFAHMDVAETDKSIDITLDVPGMTEKDLDVSLRGDELIISGERKTESEKKEKDFHRVERAYGRFERRFRLPCEVEENKIKASVKQGVLSIVLPKSAKAAQGHKKIEITGS